MFLTQTDSRTIRWIQDLSSPLFLFPPFLLFLGCNLTTWLADGSLPSPNPSSPVSWSQTEPLLITPNTEKSCGVFAVRLCLKTSHRSTVEGLFPHLSLPPDYISHQPPGLSLASLGTLNCIFIIFFSPVNQLYLWMWRHTHTRINDMSTHLWKPEQAKNTCWNLVCLALHTPVYVNVCTCSCVTCVMLVFTIEWFVHINNFNVMLNVFPWWLFLGLFDWHSSWETTWFELNWCTLPWSTTAFESDLMNEWMGGWMNEGLCWLLA